MVAFSKIACVATLAVGTLATPLTVPHAGPLALFDELKSIPKGFVSQGAASPSSTMKVQIGLKQNNIHVLQERLLDAAHPDSSNYGKWLSKEEVDSIVAPSQENIDAVKSWLSAAGISHITQPSPDWIEFVAPVSTMEKLLDTKYESFKSLVDGSMVPRTTKYSIPKSLHGIVDMVTPTTAFYHSNAAKTDSAITFENHLAERATCNPSGVMTPACINSIYNVDYTSKGSQTVATAGLLQVGASHSDFAKFAAKYVPGMKDFKDISASGGSNDGTGTVEGCLDTQYAGGLANPNPSQYIEVGPDSQDFTDQVANLASYLATTSNPPSTASASYGGTEDQFSGSYLDRVCNEFMKAGSRGISVFVSTGDYGVAGYNEGDCSSKLYVQFPSSCPWLTGVGGTQFNSSSLSSEVVAQFPEQDGVGSSGGGFSYYFPAPSYQSADTKKYVTYLGSKYKGLYQPGNRGIPDISLVSKQFSVYINSQLYQTVYGTSAASPSWAALVSVLNDYRNSKGQANLGFINPLLYGNGRSALRDVTAGTNPGCNSNGYSATTGWDPATGLGSLDFGKLRAML